MTVYHHLVCYIDVDQDIIKKIIIDLNIQKEDDYDRYRNIYEPPSEDNEDMYLNYCCCKHNDTIVKKYFEIKNINSKLNFRLSYLKDIKFFELSCGYCCDKMYEKEKKYNNERYKKFLLEKYNLIYPMFICTINNPYRAKMYIEKMNYFFESNKENIPFYEDIDEYKDFIKWLEHSSEVASTFENKFLLFKNNIYTK